VGLTVAYPLEATIAPSKVIAYPSHNTRA
jgi:hypothetical protein